ncbi:hypothetical protein B0H14DRAFT_2627852 [Mycena olivaceomarginata]|nr:hypothetical protein B0H14DRAFT_2627852 [Mycena olivaceomarginata]
MFVTPPPAPRSYNYNQTTARNASEARLCRSVISRKEWVPVPLFEVASVSSLPPMSVWNAGEAFTGPYIRYCNIIFRGPGSNEPSRSPAPFPFLPVASAAAPAQEI